jgi:hypothetical protein
MEEASSLHSAWKHVEDIRACLAAKRKLLEENIIFSLREEEYKALLARKEEAMLALEKSPEMRKLLFFLPEQSHHTPTVDSVIEFWTNLCPGPTTTLEITDRKSLGPWLIHIFQTPDECQKTLDPTSRSFLELVKSSMVFLSARRFLKQEIFWRTILTSPVYEGKECISTLVLHERLRFFDEALKKNPRMRLLDANGSLWLDSDHSTRQRILLQASSRFPQLI